MSTVCIEEQRDLCLDLLDRFLTAADETKETRFIDKLAMKGKAATLRAELSSGILQNGSLSQMGIRRLGKYFAAFHESVNDAVAAHSLRQEACYDGLKKAERLLMTALRGQAGVDGEE